MGVAVVVITLDLCVVYVDFYAATENSGRTPGHIDEVVLSRRQVLEFCKEGDVVDMSMNAWESICDSGDSL